jgi:hypothetical protein
VCLHACRNCLWILAGCGESVALPSSSGWLVLPPPGPACRNRIAGRTLSSVPAPDPDQSALAHAFFSPFSRCRLLHSSSILIPGDTVWKRCKARRLTILNDAAEYFGALRQALLLATGQVYIIGWDIHSQTRFVGPSGQAEDGFPAELGPFLKALLKARPELQINVLIWDFAALYAVEREWNSAAKFTSDHYS